MSDHDARSSRPPKLKFPKSNLSIQENNTEVTALSAKSSRQSALARAVAFPFRYWNWKTASITAGIRGSAFLLALGRHHGSKGALVEVAYVVFTAGFFSAIQQGFLGVRSRWARNLSIVAGVPITALALDCLVHHLAASPNPKSFTAGMLVFSLISAAFHLHVMENGAMLTGQQGRSFASDLQAVPGLVVSFVCAPFQWVMTATRGGVTAVEFEAGAAD